MHDLKESLQKCIGVLCGVSVCETQLNKLLQIEEKVKTQEIIVSVIGQFKRGKSTFINTILKSDILPVGIIPITSVLTKIRYGSELAKVYFKDEKEKLAPLRSLGKYISELENPNNIKGVENVDIFLPVDFLSNNVTIVDTPGVGSIHEHNTDIAYSHVQDSDALIYMLSVDSPINEIELSLLRNAGSHASKIFFAVNKIDTITPSDLEEYINYCQDVLSKTLGIDKINIYAISATHEIGVDRMLTDIENYLNGNKEDLLRVSIDKKLIRLANESISQLRLYKKILTSPLHELNNMQNELAQKIRVLESDIESAAWLLDKEAEEKIVALRSYIISQGDQLNRNTLDKLNSIYSNSQPFDPNKLLEEFSKFINIGLANQLYTLNFKGESRLNDFYLELTKKITNQIKNVEESVSEMFEDLFSVEYTYSVTDILLSEKEDFYVSVKPLTEDINLNKVVLMMPNGFVNKKIYENSKAKVEKDIDSNINNMMYNYRYKLKESIRGMKYTLNEDVGTLNEDIKKLLDKIKSEKDLLSEQTLTKLRLIDGSVKYFVYI
jgi:GTP-binding protein EngB required for normal cell division